MRAFSCFAFFGAALLATAHQGQQGDISDDQLLAMGHSQWMRINLKQYGQDSDRLGDAERKYSMALVRRNEAEMNTRPNREQLRELQLMQANLTKGACRLSDFCLYETPRGYYQKKAETLTVQSLSRYLHDEAVEQRLTQADVWETYQAGEPEHRSREEEIKTFEHRGGYRFEQHMIEYRSIAFHVGRIMKAITRASPRQKQHMFLYCQRMIRLTLGDDPLPYDSLPEKYLYRIQIEG